MRILRAEPELRQQFQNTNLSWPDRLICKNRPEQNEFNVRMFEDDFSNIFSRSGNRGLKLFELVSNRDEVALELLVNLVGKFGRRRSNVVEIDEVLLGFIEDVSKLLIRFDRAFYYLVETADGTGYYIDFLRADRIFAFCGEYFQFLPQRQNDDWEAVNGELARELRILDQSKLLCFRLPNAIRKMISSQNKVLAMIDAHQNPSTNLFPKGTIGNPNPKNHFDFKVWSNAQEIAIFRATQQTGWNARKWDSSRRSEFFDCHRAIRFRRNQLILRDAILAQLGRELTKVGKRFDANFSIEVLPAEALPSIASLDDLETALLSEAISFNKVIEYCWAK